MRPGLSGSALGLSITITVLCAGCEETPPPVIADGGTTRADAVVVDAARLDSGPAREAGQKETGAPTDGTKPADGSKPADGTKLTDGTKPKDGTTPPKDGTNPKDGTTPPKDGTTPPKDGTKPKDSKPIVDSTKPKPDSAKPDAKPQCTKASDCGKSSCLQVGSSCQLLSYLCQGGKCVFNSTTVAKASCDATTGTCKNLPGCTKDADCGTASCTQTLTTCSQKVPKCTAGTCTFTSTSLSNAKCDAATGTCKGSGGCTKNADCGNPSCTPGSTPCQQLTPTCLSGICTFKYSTVANAKCNSVTGACTGISNCTKDADCGKPSCTQNLLVCQQNIPKCQAGKCTSAAKTVSNAVCNPVTGDCLTSSGCSKDADCGKPYCSVMGTTCLQMLPVCLSSVCSWKAQSVLNGKCDTLTGMCKTAP